MIDIFDDEGEVQNARLLLSDACHDLSWAPRGYEHLSQDGPKFDGTTPWNLKTVHCIAKANPCSCGQKEGTERKNERLVRMWLHVSTST